MGKKIRQTEAKKMKRINRNNIVLLIALILFSSCGNHALLNTYVDLPDDGWLSDVSYDFELEVEEAQDASLNYLIGLRNNNDYLYSNIFFFVQVEGSEGIVHQDTLQYLLAEPGGKWLGSGIGEIKHNLLIYKQQQSLLPGVYKFTISQGMRDDILAGIEDLGLLIEQSN